MAGLGLLGSALAGGIQGAGRIAEGYMKDESAARLEAQKQAADDQRQNTINQLNREAEERRLTAQLGQWDVQNRSTAAELAIRQQQMENEAANQRGLLGLRMQEAGKQSAAEMEYRERSDIANRLSSAQEGTPEYRALTIRAKALGMLANEKEPTVSVKVANEDGTFRTVTGPKSQVDALTGTPGPRNYGGGAGADGFGTQGTQAALDERRKAEAESAGASESARAARLEADPMYRKATEELARKESGLEAQKSGKEASRKASQIKDLASRMDAVRDLYEKTKDKNPGLALSYLDSYRRMAVKLDELKGGQ